MSSEDPLPTFLIIGAQKSATRWLRDGLGEQPGVFAVDAELHYFSHLRRIEQWGIDGYRAQFAGAGDAAVVGEACPSYLAWTRKPERSARLIQEAVPDVRLLAILRNPIDRAQSALLHHVCRRRYPSGVSLLEVVAATPPESDPHGLVSLGWYGASLEPYVQRFGDQLLTLFHDDLTTDPVDFYHRASAHIAADPDFVPESINQVAYSNQGHLIRVVPRRPVPVDTLADAVPITEPDHHEADDDADEVVEARVAPLGHDERCELWSYFAADVVHLEQLLGRDLSHWDPNRTVTPAAS